MNHHVLILLKEKKQIQLWSPTSPLKRKLTHYPLFHKASPSNNLRAAQNHFCDRCDLLTHRTHRKTPNAHRKPLPFNSCLVAFPVYFLSQIFAPFGISLEVTTGELEESDLKCTCLSQEVGATWGRGHSPPFRVEHLHVTRIPSEDTESHR